MAALGIPAYMLTSTTSKENEKFIYKALEKGDGDLKILYVTPEKISKSKRFMSKLEKCHNAGRLSLISIDVSLTLFLGFIFWLLILKYSTLDHCKKVIPFCCVAISFSTSTSLKVLMNLLLPLS